jgi:hypothetical protein
MADELMADELPAHIRAAVDRSRAESGDRSD